MFPSCPFALIFHLVCFRASERGKFPAVPRWLLLCCHWWSSTERMQGKGKPKRLNVFRMPVGKKYMRPFVSCLRVFSHQKRNPLQNDHKPFWIQSTKNMRFEQSITIVIDNSVVHTSCFLVVLLGGPKNIHIIKSIKIWCRAWHSIWDFHIVPFTHSFEEETCIIVDHVHNKKGVNLTVKATSF